MRFQAVDKPTHRKNAAVKKQLCNSIFAYSVNRSSTYLCTPVGAVSLSALVYQRLHRVGKYFFDTMKPHNNAV